MNTSLIPHGYQDQAVEFIHLKRRVALLMDMGLGKTIICLLALERLRSMLPALIVAPLQCVTNVWPAEIEKFGFDLSWSIIHGEDHAGANFGFKVPDNKLLRLLDPTDIKITNYESLQWLFDECTARRSVPFKTVIFDEFDRLKSPVSKRTNFAQAISAKCENRIGLTGTPIASGYHDLWSQIYVLDRGKTFGSYEHFIDVAFEMDRFNKPQLKPGFDKHIERAIRPMVFRGDAKDLLDMPELIEHTVTVDLDDELMERYGEIEYGFLNGYDDFDQHTEASYAPLRCFCAGFVYHTDPFGNRSREDIHRHRLDAIRDVWEGIGRKPLLIGFNFTGERELLEREFGCPYIDGKVSRARSAELIKQWNAGKLPMLAGQTTSIGVGLNLQHGGRHLAWMSLPDDGRLYQQTVARLYRQGQSGTVFIYRIVTKDTIEQAVLGLLKRKILTQETLLNAMKEKR